MRKFLQVLTATCLRCVPPVQMVKAEPLKFICPECENVCRIWFGPPSAEGE